MEFYEYLNEVFDNNRLEAAPISPETLPENALTDSERKMLQLLLQLASLGQRYDEKENVFCPWMVWNDGRRTFSLEDMSEDDFLFLKGLSYEKLPLALRARVTDILWVTRKNYLAGQKAAESYLQLFVNLFDPVQWIVCINSIRRAITISAQLGKKEELFLSVCDSASRTIFPLLIKSLKVPKSLLLFVKLKLLMKQRENYWYGKRMILLRKVVKSILPGIMKRKRIM